MNLRQAIEEEWVTEITQSTVNLRQAIKEEWVTEITQEYCEPEASNQGRVGH